MKVQSENRNAKFFGLACLISLPLLSANAFAAKATRSCEDLFSISRAVISTSVAETNSGLPVAAAAAKSKKAAKSAAIDFTEPIMSVFNGSQLYTVVHGSTGKMTPGGSFPGLYKREQHQLKMLLPGEVMVDERGVSNITQLKLGSVDKQNYSVVVVDGNVHLLTGRSDTGVPKSMLQFGTVDTPLFEVGSKQKRFLPANQKDAEIAVYQDEDLTEKGTQLVLVSIKFKQPQMVGPGLTFAFELHPLADTAELRLNGRPTVIDYEYHDVKRLPHLVAGRLEKVVFSRILFEQFVNSELGFIGKHLELVQNHLTKLTNDVLGAISPSLYLRSSDGQIAYNITKDKVLKDNNLSKLIFSVGDVEFKQNYQVALGLSEVLVAIEGQTFRYEGEIDLTSTGEPAIWRDSDQIFFLKNGILHAYLKDNPRGHHGFMVELGPLASLFNQSEAIYGIPKEMSFVSYFNPQDDAVRDGAVLLSVKTPAGREATAVVRVTLLLNSTMKKKDAYLISRTALSQEEMRFRLKSDIREKPLFDALTPVSFSKEAYTQTYDPSIPHIDLLESSAGKMVRRFRHPKHTTMLADGVTYAEFTQVANVENPSGLYLNLHPDIITGNESQGTLLGQLVPRPGMAGAEGPDKYVFARLTANFRIPKEGHDKKEKDTFDPDAPMQTRRLLLTALDVKKRNGAAGFRFYVQMTNEKGQYDSIRVPEPPSGNNWFNNIEFFRDAFIIQGRGADSTHAYLFVTLTRSLDPNSDGYQDERTFGLRINLNVKDHPASQAQESLKAIPLEGVLRAKDVQTRIGFDAEGVPNFVVTPELNDDAHLFQVFNMKRVAKEYPNRSYGKNRTKLVFGDTAHVVAESTRDVYITPKDSWETTPAEVRHDYPALGRSQELAQFDNFVELAKHLDDMSDPRKPAERRILVVPDTLRDLVWDFLLSKAYLHRGDAQSFEAKKKNSTFTFLNEKLSISVFDKKKGSQEQYFANIEKWVRTKRAHSDERAFLLARMDDMTQDSSSAPHPKDREAAFRLEYVDSAKSDDALKLETNTSEIYPSSLYLLASSGPISLREFRRQKEDPTASMVILATPSEMQAFKGRHEPEIENGLLDRYKIQEIKDPDEDSMATSLAEVFHQPAVQSLDFKFSASDIIIKRQLDADQSFETVIKYAISRFAAQSADRKDSRFEGFMRFRTVFAQAVLSDKEVRRTRVIDRNFVERVITQVFNIPINLAALPPDDPLVILSRPDAPRRLNEAGYPGPFKTKKQIVDAILSQTQPDAGKAIPSSIMLVGPTGLGKTRMFLGLVKMLNLKMFNFAKPSENDDAGAIMINLRKLKDHDGAGTEEDMGVNQAINHLNSMIAKPNGHRSFILIDDAHDASNEVKQKFMTWLKGLFEAPDGMYAIRINNTTVYRPIRNLTLFIVINPLADQSIVSKFAKDKKEPSLDEMALAALSTPGMSMDQSFLRRIGHIFKWSKLPASAKAPELMGDLAKASNTLLNSMNRIALVDPRVIGKIVEIGDDVDGRTFSSTATRGLINVAAADRNSGSVVLVVPSRSQLTSKPVPTTEGESEIGANILKSIGRDTRALSLDASVDGNLVFVKLIVDAFRIPIYESFVTAVQEDAKFSANLNLQRTWLAPIMSAIADHFNSHTYISLKDLDLSAADFGIKTASEREAFRSSLKALTEGESEILPDSFKMIEAALSPDSSHAARGRRHVIAEAIAQNRPLLQKRLEEIMRVEDLEMLPTPSAWLGHLTPQLPPDSKQLGKALSENFHDFIVRIVDKNLVESRTPNIPPMTFYAATRLYLYSLDRTMLRLNWVRSAKFLLNALDLITQDRTLSQKAGVQSFLFKDPARLIKPSIPHLTTELLGSVEALDEISPETRRAQAEEFSRAVNQYLSPLTH